jgi:hypothetical protein
MPLIHVLFYAPNPDDHFLNHIVTRYDPPFSHCDVQFEDGMASSVFQHETVYWRKRSFRKPGYKKISIPVSHADYGKAYNMCQDRAAQNFAFDAIGMYTLPLPASMQYERDGFTFCSKHCTEVLQLARVRAVAGLVPKSITPSALHDALQGSAVLHSDRLVDLRIM